MEKAATHIGTCTRNADPLITADILHFMVYVKVNLKWFNTGENDSKS